MPTEWIINYQIHEPSNQIETEKIYSKKKKTNIEKRVT